MDPSYFLLSSPIFRFERADRNLIDANYESLCTGSSPHSQSADLINDLSTTEKTKITKLKTISTSFKSSSVTKKNRFKNNKIATIIAEMTDYIDKSTSSKTTTLGPSNFVYKTEQSILVNLNAKSSKCLNGIDNLKLKVKIFGKKIKKFFFFLIKFSPVLKLEDIYKNVENFDRVVIKEVQNYGLEFIYLFSMTIFLFF